MNTWTLSWSGLRTVTELEIKQRIRSKRWIWALVGWVVLLGTITMLVMLAARSMYSVEYDDGAAVTSAGPTVFAAITYLVLGMGLVIAPAFTATAINGDRSAGTLATLQATRLSAVEIAAGKLTAAWLTATVFLVAAVPFIALSMAWGDISLAQVVVVFLVVLTEVAVVCAIGLGWSAVISRPAGSAMLTYLSVVFLTVITVVAFALSMVLVIVKQPVQVWGLPPAVVAEYGRQVDDYFEKNPDKDNPPPAPVEKCTWFEEERQVTYTDRVWWLLLANPFIIVSDAAPLPEGAAQNLADYNQRGSDPMASLRYQVRRLSDPPELRIDECSQYYDGQPGYVVTYDDQGNAQVTTKNGVPVQTSPVQRPVVNVETPVWPGGLAFHLLLGAVFFWVAVRRLQVPYRSLRAGTRVA
jgi:ABC-2 type transport system permease protein